MKLSVWDFIISEQRVSNAGIFLRWPIFRKSCSGARGAERAVPQSPESPNKARSSTIHRRQPTCNEPAAHVRRGGGDVSLVTVMSAHPNRRRDRGSKDCGERSSSQTSIEQCFAPGSTRGSYYNLYTRLNSVSG